MEEDRVNEALGFVARYAKNISDWATLKKELLKYFSPQERKHFSTRDPITKQQSMNQFEEMLARKWSELTGTNVIITNRDAKARKVAT